jgi:hypothetical protein
VVIVTAATPEWVTDMVWQYYPTLHDQFSRLPLISTRTYGLGSDKTSIFEHYMKLFAKKGWKREFVSLSDSPADHEHFWKTCLGIENSVCHSFRFLMTPNIVSLRSELQQAENLLSNLNERNDKTHNIYHFNWNANESKAEYTIYIHERTPEVSTGEHRIISAHTGAYKCCVSENSVFFLSL